MQRHPDPDHPTRFEFTCEGHEMPTFFIDRYTGKAWRWRGRRDYYGGSSPPTWYQTEMPEWATRLADDCRNFVVLGPRIQTTLKRAEIVVLPTKRVHMWAGVRYSTCYYCQCDCDCEEPKTLDIT